jgi:hypothetical protein
MILTLSLKVLNPLWLQLDDDSGDRCCRCAPGRSCLRFGAVLVNQKGRTMRSVLMAMAMTVLVACGGGEEARPDAGVNDDWECGDAEALQPAPVESCYVMNLLPDCSGYVEAFRTEVKNLAGEYGAETACSEGGPARCEWAPCIRFE